MYRIKRWKKNYFSHLMIWFVIHFFMYICSSIQSFTFVTHVFLVCICMLLHSMNVRCLMSLNRSKIYTHDFSFYSSSIDLSKLITQINAFFLSFFLFSNKMFIYIFENLFTHRHFGGTVRWYFERKEFEKSRYI